MFESQTWMPKPDSCGNALPTLGPAAAIGQVEPDAASLAPGVCAASARKIDQHAKAGLHLENDLAMPPVSGYIRPLIQASTEIP
jgi:hypothetical protein